MKKEYDELIQSSVYPFNSLLLYMNHTHQYEKYFKFGHCIFFDLCTISRRFYNILTFPCVVFQRLMNVLNSFQRNQQINSIDTSDGVVVFEDLFNFTYQSSLNVFGTANNISMLLMRKTHNMLMNNTVLYWLFKARIEIHSDILR